eukprot:CAMPEP_0116130998 /NCGR_PEP_ID=MMETSP0329-20121206/8776_1 /TAXON_ID=697910 /ORGANISM="Pseudo-nitzschia arenysensis, Strain B593" /LENGTH=971 /DNA_ID=CAMNT_0003625409 /DNA_START=176 /DNA_END=3091 /DNA_ORIENTATION=+
MNNPMQNSNLLRSPGSGPPIAKKQRGGTTPGSIKSRPRSRVGPPPTGRGGPPPTEVVDDAIARRRAELRRLQEKARGAMGSSARKPPPSSSSSLSRSKSNNNPPPPIPMSKRTSDIFPTAPKSPSMIPKPTQTSKTSTLSMKPAIASRKQSDIFPSVPKLNDTANEDATEDSQIDAFAAASQFSNPKQKSANPNLPPETPQTATAIPPTPAVGRRLEFPSSQKTAAGTTAAKAKAKPPPPVRSRSKSPTKAVNSSFTGTSSTSPAAAAPTAGPPRAKSAPPRRPPGPPPGAPPAAPSANKSTKVKAIKKSKAKRPAPVRPGTLSLLPTVKTKSPKSQASSPEKPKNDTKSKPPTTEPKDEKDAKEESAAPPVVASGPPVVAYTVGKGNLDTSKISQPPTKQLLGQDSQITETPKGQKSAALGTGGADTPPSSGSSARRQKLQLMRQQALVASTLKTAPKEASKGPPSKTSFYTGSSEEPATAAFAKAIAPKEKENMAPPVIPNLADVRPKQEEKPKASPMQSAAQARLEDAYKKSEQEKMKALIKIKELEDKLSQSAKEQLEKSKQTHQQQKLDVQTLLSLADTQGHEAALNWAKNNSDGVLPSSPSRPASRTGFNTGMGATPRKLPGTGLTMQPTPHRRARMAIRALKARPQNQPPDLVNESPEATERRLIRQFKEAVQFVSHEFSSELATYIVRRPYGIPTNPQGLFDHLRPPTEKLDTYQKRAHVSDMTTIEVAAIVKADNTPLMVFGMAGIRYQSNPSSRNVPPEFKHFEDVDAQDRPLGHVTYIDGQANEKEYSLDEILEEALLVREQYCGTLTSTALALPDLKQQQSAQKPPAAEAAKAKEPSKSQQPQKEPPKQEQQQMQHQQPPPGSDIDSGSSDVLVDFLGMVISFIFNLIYGIFIGTPLRIVRTTIVLIVAFTILQTLHLYLADGYNEWALREFTTSNASTCSSVLASDLSWFSNQHPGIM